MSPAGNGGRTAMTADRPGVIRRYLERPYTSVQLLLLAGGALLGVGLLMSASTTISASLHDTTGTMWTQLVKQLVFVLLGIPIFWVAARSTPRRIRLLAYPLLLLSLLLLVGALVPGIGLAINGAHRWIALGGLQLQPSEIGKLALLLWGADLLARKQQLGTLTRTRHLFVPLLPGAVLFCTLVMLEPDLGTTLVYLLIVVGLLWAVGVPLRWFAGLLFAIIVAVSLLAVAAPYRLQRLTTFVDPFAVKNGAGFHTVESLYALASGGLLGVGLGQGTSKYGWVPNASTDYVFAIIGEELGLVGCVVVLALFALFAYAGARVARRSGDQFVRLAAGGATVWISGQAIINVGYVTGLLPSTGIPLPFISVGGTSLLMTCLVLGMLVSFARHEPAAVAAAVGSASRTGRSRLARWCKIPLPALQRPTGRRRPGRRQSGNRVVAPAPARGARTGRRTPERAPTLRPAARLAATGTEGRPVHPRIRR